jgi:hypothetical protein
MAVLVVAVLVWLIAPGARRSPPEGDEIEPVDEAELDVAENEVRDLDVHQRPEEGFEGDDWGPGVGKR